MLTHDGQNNRVTFLVSRIQCMWQKKERLRCTCGESAQRPKCGTSGVSLNQWPHTYTTPMDAPTGLDSSLNSLWQYISRTSFNFTIHNTTVHVYTRLFINYFTTVINQTVLCKGSQEAYSAVWSMHLHSSCICIYICRYYDVVCYVHWDWFALSSIS